MPPPTVLIIMPDGATWDGFADRLRHAGCHVETAADGRAAEQTAATASPDVVVLPARLPDADGLDVCRRIRRGCNEKPGPLFLLMPDECDRDASMERLGVGTLLTWNHFVNDEGRQIRCGELLMDVPRHRTVIGKHEVQLTATEFRLLAAMAQHPGRVFSRAELSRACRGEQRHVQARTIDVHVKSTRRKLGKHAHLIETVYGVGYRLREPDDRE